METNNSTKVNCIKCKHYAVTWDPKRPNTCKLLDFKSVSMPSKLVYNSTGKVCECFEEKHVQSANNANNNLNSQTVIVSIGNKEKHI